MGSTPEWRTSQGDQAVKIMNSADGYPEDGSVDVG